MRNKEDGPKPDRKEPNPMEHWQIDMDLTPEGSDTPAGAFLPRCGYKRPSTHVKTNECDH